MAHVHLPLPLPSTLNPDIDPTVETTLLKATAKDKEDRFDSARALVDSVSPAVRRVPVTAAGDPSETTQMDTVDIEAADDAVADTAVMGAPTVPGVTAPTAAPPASETAAPPPAPSQPRRSWVIPGGVAVAVAAVAVIGVIVALSGDGDEDDDLGGTPVTAAAPVAATSVTASPVPTVQPITPTPALLPTATPSLTLAEAVANLEKLTNRTEENVVALRKLTPEADIETHLRTGTSSPQSLGDSSGGTRCESRSSRPKSCTRSST